MEQHDLLSNDLYISSLAQEHLTASAKWARFLAIVGFIGCVLMFFGGIYMQVYLSGLSAYAGETVRYVGITYVILSIILFFPCLYLNKFSARIQEAIRSSSQENADAAFSSLKSVFKFYGIFAMIMLIFLALAFLGGMLGSMR